MYIEYSEYNALYPDTISETAFPSIEGRAERLIDNLTTGIDGIAKLREYFPTKEADANAVKSAIADCIHDMHLFDTYDSNKDVTSVSSGSETIHYASRQNVYAKQGTERTAYLNNNVTTSLRGLRDSRGVSLLYRG